MVTRTDIATEVIYCDDNYRRLAALPESSVDLIYLDPPFFSNRHYEVIWGDEAEVRSFEDRWEGGIHAYIDWMRPRLMHMHRVLAPEGSLYLHCDPNASHYLKVAMDDVFGPSSFRTEVIWKRTSAHSDARGFGRVHDTILYYTKGRRYTWNPQPQKLKPEEYRGHDIKRDPDGRAYRLADASAAKPPGRFQLNGKWPPNGSYWAYSKKEFERLEREGRLVFNKNGTPRIKRYLDELPGVQLQDVWTDILSLNSAARERLGYPTQKPEALLERLIRASTNAGDVVLDPFCGCGTTIAVAQRLGRRWIGIDVSPTAVNIMKERVAKLGASAEVHGLATTVDDLRGLGPFEFQNWVLQRVNATPSPRRSGDMGVDGLSFMEHLPIQVKQSERVGRNVVDNFETAVERAGKHAGYIIAFSFTRGAYEEAARARGAGKPAIGLVQVADLARFADAVESADLNDLARLFERRSGADSEVPDLLRLFAAASRRRSDRPLPRGRAPSARPTVEELLGSVRQPRDEHTVT